MNRRVLELDICEGDILPSEEILKGKVYRQHGRLVTVVGLMEYFLEREPKSEHQMELMDMELNVVFVDAAIFEMWCMTDDQWVCAGKGSAPLDIELYKNQESGYFF